MSEFIGACMNNLYIKKYGAIDTYASEAVDYNDYEVMRELDNGTSIVKTKKGEHYNYLNAEGRLLSDTWFDNTYNFKEGFAIVLLNGKCNYLNAEGQLLLRFQ